jgi:hypothetical protein
VYTYSWKKALENKYINEYDIVTPRQLNMGIRELIPDSDIDFVKTLFLISNITTHKRKKCILYAPSIEDATKYMEMINNFRNICKLNIKSTQINCHTAHSVRKIILDDFNNFEGIYVICNVHILDEGVDLPSCDSVFITNPSLMNTTNLIQRMSRCLRYKEDKGKCIILVWTRSTLLEKTMSILGGTEYFGEGKRYVPSVKLDTEIKITHSIITSPPSSSSSVKVDTKLNISTLHSDLMKIIGDVDCIVDVYNTMWFSAPQLTKRFKAKHTFAFLRPVPDKYKTQFKYLEKYVQLVRSNSQPHETYINTRGLYVLIFKSRGKLRTKSIDLIVNRLIPYVYGEIEH